MATEPDPTTLTCENEDGNQAAGLVSHPLSDEDPTGTWYLYCDQCIGRFTDPEFRVIYLDPTRQRRPNPNHHDDSLPIDDNDPGDFATDLAY